MTTSSFTAGSNTGSSPYYEYISKVGTDGKTEIVDGVVRDKWNPYSVDMTMFRRTKGDGYNAWMSSSGTPLYPDNNMILSAQNKLVSKIKNHQFNLAVAVGEGTMTIGMVKDNLRSIALAARDVRHGEISTALRRFRSQFDANSSIIGNYRHPNSTRPSVHLEGGKLTTKDLAGRWLELQYGWLPLLSDVYEAQNAFYMRSAAPRRELIKAVQTQKGVMETSASISNYSVSSAYKNRVYYWYELTEELPIARSVGLYDPWTVAWELFPYSFVVDWFIPIGTYLENLQVIPKLNGRVMRTVTQSVHRQGFPKKPAYMNGTFMARRYYLRRTVGHSIQAVRPQVKSFPEAMSPKHVWNAIALARQLFESRI